MKYSPVQEIYYQASLGELVMGTPSDLYKLWERLTSLYDQNKLKGLECTLLSGYSAKLTFVLSNNSVLEFNVPISLYGHNWVPKITEEMVSKVILAAHTERS